MKIDFIRWINPWLYRSRQELEDCKIRLADYDSKMDGVKKTSSEILDGFARQIAAGTEREDQLQHELDKAREQITQLIAEKQQILDSQSSSQNDQVKLIDQLNVQLADLRGQINGKEGDLSMLRKQLARLRVWILRTHKVDLASFMAIPPKEELVEQ